MKKDATRNHRPSNFVDASTYAGMLMLRGNETHFLTLHVTKMSRKNNFILELGLPPCQKIKLKKLFFLGVKVLMFQLELLNMYEVYYSEILKGRKKITKK